MKIFIGMETSGALRRRFQDQGHYVVSCDRLPAEDGAVWAGGSHNGGHWQGDVFDVFAMLHDEYQIDFDLGIFHPECTFHTLSAAWAFNDPNYEKYPGVGYHQRVKTGTLVGAARRRARASAENDVERIKALPIRSKIMENPRGTIPTRTNLGRPQQVIQPYQFGDDASKETCLWQWDCPPLPIDPAKRVAGRLVTHNGKIVERWSNQTDSGQNRLSPGDDRWKDRSRTFPGIADAMATFYGDEKNLA